MNRPRAAVSVARLRQAVTRLPAPVLLLLVALGSGWVGLLAWLIIVGPGDYPDRDATLYPALMFGASGLTIARGIVRRSDRSVWVLLGLAMALSAVADLIYASVVSRADVDAFPTVADPVYLSYYPLAVAGVVTYVRRRARNVPRVVWTDGVTLALAAGALVGAIFLAPLTETLTGGPLAILVGAAYPVGDTVVMLIAAVGVAIVGLRRGESLVWLGGAMVVSGLADLIYWNELASGAYVEGTWLDALWPLSALLCAVGAWVPVSDRAEEAHGARGLMVVPAGTVVAATGTLLFGTFHHTPLVTVVMAVVAMAGVLQRLNGTVRHTLMMMDARRDASTDDLTGLLNRRGFTTAAQRELAARVHGVPVALLHADLDGFKEVNDSLGHEAGDTVLKAVTARLAADIDAPGILLGRLGGDEFAVLVPRAMAVEASGVAARMRQALGAPFEVAGTHITLDVSVGISVAPYDGQDLSTLLRRADIAMYRAKADRQGVAIFDSSVDEAGEGHLQRVAELRRAISAGELALHYQPKIALATGRAEGVEALVRWNRPGHGVVPPDRFLPLAAKAGLMGAVTSTVLELAAVQAASWRRAGIELPIAVNIPASALVDEGLPGQISVLLSHHGLPGDALQVEITEEALLKDRERAQRVLAGLRSLGVRAAIDDYGTGYSSLVYLHELVVDEVKIDRSFVVPLLLDERSGSIVKSTIDLVHSLGLRVVAEGIEEARVADELVRMGCDTAQGYHWTRPLPADEFDAWYAMHRTLSTACGAEPVA